MESKLKKEILFTPNSSMVGDDDDSDVEFVFAQPAHRRKFSSVRGELITLD